MENGVLLTETDHGFYCINAGIDLSNVSGKDMAAFLPVDSDKSADTIRNHINNALGVNIAVVITDTWGRPWRVGVINVAIGISGMSALQDYRGMTDSNGMDLKASVIAIVDEIASASELVMNKLDNIPVALIKGYSFISQEGSIEELIRPRDQDLFR
jgi:coenzyme F420-0:L-glutamate ligase/coenzyme F420-1:gamma-L-glutamate ligase